MDLRVIRVSDAERRAVVEELADHYASGRLTLDELRERTAEAWGARTDADLVVALRELPDESPDVPPAPELGWRVPRLSPPAHALLAAAGVSTAWAVEAAGSTPGDQWPLALAVVWGAGVALHAGGAWLHRHGAVRPVG